MEQTNTAVQKLSSLFGNTNDEWVEVDFSAWANADEEKAVSDWWGEIWQMDLDRSFTGNLEEYPNADPENCDIDIYIALK